MGWERASKFLFGEGEEDKQQTLLTKNQSSALDNALQNPIDKSPLFSAGSSQLQKLLSGDPEAFAAFEKPFYENFEQNIAPSIARRYSGLGTGSGALSSSAFNSSIAQAGGKLQTDLAAQRGQLQMQALPQALAYAQQPYSNTNDLTRQRTFENIHRPASYGLVGEAATSFVKGAAGAAGKALVPVPSLPGQ